MSDAPSTVATTKLSGGTKPRLSLLSSKQQAVVRLKSDDSPDHQPHVTILSNPNQATTNVDDYGITRNDTSGQESNKQQFSTTNPLIVDNLMINGGGAQRRRNINEDDHGLENPGNSNNNTSSSSSSKMNISKEDLIRLLSLLKSELQSKEIALAAIKCEQLKRLLNPVEISRSSLANTYIELQDRFKSRDLNNNDSKQKTDQPDSASNNKTTLTKPFNSETSRNVTNTQQQTKEQQDSEEDNQESLNILNTLLELLDRHPLLALPRDSIYCLDYNCNEVSTKNYLNLKIQHLDNLINQHRRYRYHMNERLKKSEQRYLDLARELEYERNARFCDENSSFYGSSSKSVLLKHIEHLKETIEKEKRDKEAIVMTLLNELLDERESNENLKKKLNDLEKSKNNFAGDKEKVLMLQKELENITMQLKKQSMVYAKDRNEMQSKLTGLELENSSLKSKLEQQEKQLASLVQAKSQTFSNANINQSAPPTAPRPTEIGVTARPQTKTFTPATINTKQLPNVTPRSSITSSGSTVLTSKSSPIAKAQTTATYTSNGSMAQQRSLASRVVNSSFQGDSDKTTLTSPVQQHQESPRQQNFSSQRSTAATSSVVSRGLTGGSQAASVESGPTRAQPLFKSASVSSNNVTQQARNLKTSISSVGANHPAAPIPSRSSSGGQLLNKPQVPAKPAQLLDQQRKLIN